MAPVPGGFIRARCVARRGEFEDAALVAGKRGPGREERVEARFPDVSGLFLGQGRVVEFDVDARIERVVELFDSVCGEEYHA